MPLLLYFLTDPGLALPSQPGYAGTRVETLSAAGLRCWYSRVAAADVKNFTAENAVAIHQLTTAALLAGGVVPFRFPTLLPDEPELERYLAENGERLRAGLESVRDAVQMEVHIGVPDPSPDPALSPGRAYMLALRDKLAKVRDAEQEILSCTAAMARQWTHSGHRRCALVARHDIDRFRQAIAAARVAPEVQVRVTGPWPATAFLDAAAQPAGSRP